MSVLRRPWLTLFAVVALVILVALGTWQVRRLAWKTALLEQVAAAPTATVVGIDDALGALEAGEQVEWRRVRVRCGPLSAAAPEVVYAVIAGDIAWRALHPCTVAPGVGLWVDRGVILAAGEAVAAPRYDLPAPRDVVGLLRRDPTRPALPGPLSGYRLVVQSETPPPTAVRPVPTPPEIANSHLGYAITWYGLAAALVGVYVAVLVQDRRRSPLAATP